MRILLHDFPGHPFQAELARSLGDRGHQVLHLQCASFTSGKGNVQDDPDSNTRFESISLGETFEKYKTGRRLRQELRYSRHVVTAVRRFEPDVVILSNDPLLSKAAFAAWAGVRRVPWVFWLQDIWSLAMAREAARRSRLGGIAGRGFQLMEAQLLRKADAVVPVTPDFDGVLDDWRVKPERRTVIENWAPLAEIPPRDKCNEWSTANGFGQRFTYLYAGTLGIKHNPDAIYDLARSQPDADVIVISEGLGADRLRDLDAAAAAPNLHLLPFQEWQWIPDVLATADVLLVLLEEAAGTFSVPSKILTSLCAGRAILAAMPESNLGARTIVRAGAGVIVPPNDSAAYTAAAAELRADDERRLAMAASGRRYAEQAFDLEAITDRFTGLLEGIARPKRVGSAT
jgi:glycosyltransferase involved in cell wall biosynthesis